MSCSLWPPTYFPRMHHGTLSSSKRKKLCLSYLDISKLIWDCFLKCLSLSLSLCFRYTKLKLQVNQDGKIPVKKWEPTLHIHHCKHQCSPLLLSSSLLCLPFTFSPLEFNPPLSVLAGVRSALSFISMWSFQTAVFLLDASGFDSHYHTKRTYWAVTVISPTSLVFLLAFSRCFQIKSEWRRLWSSVASSITG